MGAFEKLCKKASRENPVEHPASKGSSSSVSPTPDLSPLRAFQREYRAAEDWGGRYRVLRRHLPLVGGFGQFGEDVHQETLSALIGYRYVKKAYIKAGMMMPDAMARNLYALESNSVDQLTPNMARMMSILIQTSSNRGESDMKGKKEAKKETNLGVSQYYLEIFENQAKAKLTDQQIADVIESKTGAMPTFKNISSYRHAYNNGNIQGQSKCPAEKCKAVRVSKAKPKKPMSEETKAKLKAYTAAKKNKTAKKK